LSQANAPGFAPIPDTKKEINKITDMINSLSIRSLRLEDDAATKANLLTAMENHSWVHLACHGTQDAKQPLASSFALADGRLELITIIKSDLKHAEFAFLSACQTSTGDIELSDESVHLAAGMLAAGYRGVVGTMWSISDSHAPQFAEDFYRYLLARSGEVGGRDMLDGEQAAYALHHAVQQLRKRKDSDLHIWAPYVHWGL
jgi:CHAT domain-containing protein